MWPKCLAPAALASQPNGSQLCDCSGLKGMSVNHFSAIFAKMNEVHCSILVKVPASSVASSVHSHDDECTFSLNVSGLPKDLLQFSQHVSAHILAEGGVFPDPPFGTPETNACDDTVAMLAY